MANLSDRLKDAIQSRHLRMESLPFVTALSGGTLPRDCYIAQLRAMAVIHAALDRELDYTGAEQIPDRPSRLAHLRADLSILDCFTSPDCLAAARQALHIAAVIRQGDSGQTADRLTGFRYVLEGMTLGNVMHLPDAVRCLGDQGSEAVRYYAGYGERTAECWEVFRCTLDRIPVGSHRQERIIAAAHELFDLLEPLYASLYPVPADGWGFTAGMLNPEAGSHQVPGTAAEIEAAVTAARRCREEFPYFDERFRERGQAFARSDAAWLVTLGSLDPDQLLAQTEWLGRVLGNRGMPRITLERQLFLLYEELARLGPEQARAAAALVTAARSLESERSGYLPEPLFRQIARRFYEATDSELQGRFLRTGELIAAAVCDEAAGITGAVTSLIPWLTDGSRFDSNWTAAVHDTVAAARRGVVSRSTTDHKPQQLKGTQ